MKNTLVCLLSLYFALTLNAMEQIVLQPPQQNEEALLYTRIHRSLTQQSVMSLCSYQNLLYVGCANGDLKVWDLNEKRWICGTNIGTPATKMVPYTSADGQFHIIIGCGNGNVIDYNTSNNSDLAIAKHAQSVAAFCFRYDSPYQLCTAGLDGCVKLIDLRNKAEIGQLSFNAPVASIIALPDTDKGHDRIAVGLENGTLIIYNLYNYNQKIANFGQNEQVISLHYNPRWPEILTISLASGAEWQVNFNTGWKKRLERIADKTTLVFLKVPLQASQEEHRFIQVTEKDVLEMHSIKTTPDKATQLLNAPDGFILSASFFGSNPYLLALGSTNSRIYLLDLRNSPQTRLSYTIEPQAAGNHDITHGINQLEFLRQAAMNPSSDESTTSS